VTGTNVLTIEIHNKKIGDKDAALIPELKLETGPQINLSWDASTDNVGVTGYHIYRDGGGTPIATVTTGTTYEDTGLSPLTTYTYKVSAIDAVSNESAQSSQASDTAVGALTTIDTGDTWKYFKGTSYPAAGWTGVSFDDSGWLSGATGIGMGDFDDATELTDMQDNYISVFTRKTFNVSDASAVTTMTLRMDYDDGFVSYINGVEVTRANMPGGTPDHNTAASGGHKASKGTGALAEFDLVAYTGNLVTGTNVLTVEIHNQKIGDKTLTMIPELEILNTPEPDVTAPSTPANLAATAVSSSQINLSWDASTDNVAVTGYNIYRDGGGTPIATVTGTTYQDTGLSVSTLYTYNVSAVDFNLNESAQSSSDSDTTIDVTAPSTPANFTATAVLESQINLSWDASTDDVGVTGYKIYRDGGGTPIATVAGTTYQDTGLSASTLYAYNVSAIDAVANESAQSSQASDTTFTPDVTPPSTPANLAATAVSSSQIDLSWDASTDDVGVTGYNIYRDGGGTPIVTVQEQPIRIPD
jgi:chitodextrinase